MGNMHPARFSALHGVSKFRFILALVYVAVFYILRWLGVPWFQDPPR